MAHKIYRVTGSVRFQNDHTGEEVSLGFKPFEACEGTPWTHVVDMATDDVWPEGDWSPIDEKISESVIYGRGCTCLEGEG